MIAERILAQAKRILTQLATLAGLRPQLCRERHIVVSLRLPYPNMEWCDLWDWSILTVRRRLKRADDTSGKVTDNAATRSGQSVWAEFFSSGYSLA
ncbi:MAG: hypothetical protein HOK61_11510 [Alphaproteobacteria bacterium]|jgi:hypothetical protein|nr:hypothetical protein [Alphaproteobacteria bacterium]